MVDLARFERFSFSYPQASRRALADLDLAVGEGEFVLLAGGSGSGKSTLLRALSGLAPHVFGGDVRGELSVCGLDLREAGPAELGGRVGLLAQDPESQVVSTTVRGEIELPLDLLGERPAARARAIEEVGLALGISRLLERTTDALSGGELQRVALAAALVLRPRLILLDEPTSQLDPVAGDELIGALRRLNEEWGMTVVLAEHRIERCLAAVDRVVVLDRGRIAFDGDPPSLGEWASVHEPSLLTPGAQMFSLAGIRPLPVAVKDARRTLAERGLGAGPGQPVEPTAPGRDKRRARLGRLLRRAPQAQPALEARDLWIELDGGSGPEEVLRGLDLRIEPGEAVALMGRNGAGKSTLMRASAGLVRPVRGAIGAPAGCALLPQSPADLFVRERVADELPGEQGRRALHAVDLAWAADADPRDLSGGERERLALAIVMAGRERALPGVICLDEPTRGMDGSRKQALSAWLRRLTDQGAAVLVATHDVEFAARFARRVVLLGDGDLIADGGVDEILSGGWYFATEVARILGGGGATTPQAGAETLRARARGREGSAEKLERASR